MKGDGGIIGITESESAVADLDGFLGCRQKPPFKFSSVAVSIVVLAIYHSKQLYTTVFQ